MKFLILACLAVAALAGPTQNKGKIVPKAHQPSSRIVGGQPAFAEQFPFVAGITIHTSAGTYFCGGALLGAQWILTAAQCVESANELTITLGSNHLRRQDPYRITVATSDYIIHPDFDGTNLNNDIAIIKLRLPISFTETIQPVAHLPLSRLPDFVTVTALGWGQVNDERPGLVDDLQYAIVTSLTNEDCKTIYGNQITDSMLCAEGNYNEGTCNGDTGSPLIQHYSRTGAVPVGVASFLSTNGCESTDPSGFTRVYPHNAWIRNVTGLELS